MRHSSLAVVALVAMTVLGRIIGAGAAAVALGAIAGLLVTHRPRSFASPRIWFTR